MTETRYKVQYKKQGTTTVCFHNKDEALAYLSLKEPYNSNIWSEQRINGAGWKRVTDTQKIQ